MDLSSQMVDLRVELQRVLSGDSDNAYDTAPLRTEVLCQADVERTIVECISAQRYHKALQCVRYYGSVVTVHWVTHSLVMQWELS